MTADVINIRSAKRPVERSPIAISRKSITRLCVT